MGCKVLAPVVITASNGAIYADDSGADFAATIPAGTYWITGDGESDDLLQEIEDQLNASGTDTWTVTISSGVVSIRCDQNWSIDWDHANTSFDCTTLGITDDSAAFSGNANADDSGDAQHLYGFYSDNAKAEWRFGTDDHTSQHRAADGSPWTTTSPEARTWRRLGFTKESGKRAVPRSGHVNEDWGTGLFPYLASDELSRVYLDATDEDVYTTGYWDRRTCAGFSPRLFSAGVDLWDWGAVLMTPTDVDNSPTVYPDVLFGSNENGHIYDSDDYGVAWTDQGAILGDYLYNGVHEFADMGSGIILAATGRDKKIFRSVNGGADWTDEGALSGTWDVESICFVSGGIAVAGCDDGHIWRTINYGDNWSDLGDKGNGHDIFGIASFGGGVVVAVTDDGKTTRSADSGATWGGLVDQGGGAYNPIISLGGGIGLIGEWSGALVIRTDDSGATWGSVGQICASTHRVNDFVDFGGGIVVASASDVGGTPFSTLCRSLDSGATWADLGDHTSSRFDCFAHLGGGHALGGKDDGHLWKTDDDGATWSDIGAVCGFGGIRSLTVVST